MDVFCIFSVFGILVIFWLLGGCDGFFVFFFCLLWHFSSVCIVDNFFSVVLLFCVMFTLFLLSFVLGWVFVLCFLFFVCCVVLVVCLVGFARGIELFWY